MTTQYEIIIGKPLPGAAEKQALIAETFRAAGMWLASYIAGTGTVTIRLDFDPTVETMQAGSLTNRSMGSFVRQNGSAYTLRQDSVAAEVQSGVDLNGTQADGVVTVGIPNLDRFYWFDPTLATQQDIPADKTDGFRVALHELLHTLGFSGFSDGDPTTNEQHVSMFDQFVQQVGGRSFFAGSHAVAQFGGPVPITNVHLGDSVSFGNQILRGDTTVMSYDFVPNGSRIDIDAVIRAILRDMGFTVRDQQAGFAGTPGKLNTAVINSSSDGFDIVKTLDLTWLAFNGRQDYSYLLTNEQRLQFTDTNVALDTGAGEIGGQAFRIYQAAFARTPDKAGLGYWINAMDSGLSLERVAAMFVQSKEFEATYGTQFASTDIVGKLYQNILQRPGDSAGIQFWANALDTNAAQLSEVLAGFSESAENVAFTATLIGEGFTYLAYMS